MNCSLDSLIGVLPSWMRNDVDKHGKFNLQEIRMRINLPPELITATGTVLLNRRIYSEDIEYCINAASRYSPWTAQTAAQGYITAQGGHRIGICGEAIITDGIMTGIRRATMLCIRVAREFPGIAKGIPSRNRSILIIGRPGSGKTTLLRDLIRTFSESSVGSVSVVDERGELFPLINGVSIFNAGKHTDILSGCRKDTGIDSVLRCMGPTAIAIDEITAQSDTIALQNAAYCGVQLFATAHAGSKQDFLQRTVYRPLVESRIFDTLLVMQPDKSWSLERI